MSKEVYKGVDFRITNFYGGAIRGACVQITLDNAWRKMGYLQITRDELYTICQAVRDDIEIEY